MRPFDTTASVLLGALLASVAPEAFAQSGPRSGPERAIAPPGRPARAVAMPILTGDLPVGPASGRASDEPFPGWRIDWSDGRSGPFVAGFRTIDGPAIGPDAPLSAVRTVPLRVAGVLR